MTAVVVAAVVGLALSLGWQAYTLVRSRRRAAKERAELAMARLVNGVGQVCISASSLEWSLAYLTGVVEGWDDEKFAHVIARVRRPLEEFHKVMPKLEIFGADDLARILADAEALLGRRGRVVHSVMMLDTTVASAAVYEAWHAKTDATWTVVAEDLNALALEIMNCTAEVVGLTQAFLEAFSEQTAR